MAITSKHNQLVLKDNSCVAVTSCRPFAFDVMNLSFTLSTEHRWSSVVEAHGSSNRFSLAHHLIILVKVAGVVVFDQERTLHVVTCWWIQSDLSFILETLSFLKQCKCVHGPDTSCTSALTLFVCRLVSLLHRVLLLRDRALKFKWWIQILAGRACLRRVACILSHWEPRSQTVCCSIALRTSSNSWRPYSALDRDPSVFIEWVEMKIVQFFCHIPDTSKDY